MGKKIKEGIFFSFVNQKGGVGKSTLTAFFANYLHTEGKKYDLKIAVIDADTKQRSLHKLRQTELRQAELRAKENGEENKIIKEDQYEVINYSSAEVADHVEFLKNEYDIILIDLPGNMMEKGVITSYFLIDFAVVPFEPNILEIQATDDFIRLYLEKILPVREKEHLKTKIFGILNKVNPNLLETKEFLEMENPFKIPIFKHYFKDSKVLFQRNLSTIENIDNEHITETYEEILTQLINYANNE